MSKTRLTPGLRAFAKAAGGLVDVGRGTYPGFGPATEPMEAEISTGVRAATKAAAVRALHARLEAACKAFLEADGYVFTEEL